MNITHEILGNEVEKKITWEISISIGGSLELKANGFLVLWIDKEGELTRNNLNTEELKKFGLKISQSGKIYTV